MELSKFTCISMGAAFGVVRPQRLNYTIDFNQLFGGRLSPEYKSVSPELHSLVAPVAETGFSHRLTTYKIVGHFFGLSYRKISRSNKVENSFF